MKKSKEKSYVESLLARIKHHLLVLEMWLQYQAAPQPTMIFILCVGSTSTIVQSLNQLQNQNKQQASVPALPIVPRVKIVANMRQIEFFKSNNPLFTKTAYITYGIPCPCALAENKKIVNPHKRPPIEGIRTKNKDSLTRLCS